MLKASAELFGSYLLQLVEIQTRRLVPQPAASKGRLFLNTIQKRKVYQRLKNTFARWAPNSGVPPSTIYKQSLSMLTNHNSHGRRCPSIYGEKGVATPLLLCVDCGNRDSWPIRARSEKAGDSYTLASSKGVHSCFRRAEEKRRTKRVFNFRRNSSAWSKMCLHSKLG